MLPAWVEEEVDEMAVFAVMGVVSGRMDGVACMKWVGLAPESSMNIIPLLLSRFIVA